MMKHLGKYPFSLNMDESTSTGNNKKVLATIVSYYNPELGKVVVEHLCSVELIKANTAAIFASLENTFATGNIPWTNLVSILMDSCNVMRGTKNGLEVTLRREKAPHLLNIDGDSCHHIHNCAKKFCQPFSNWVEKLFTDIFNDHKWSSDLKDFLSQVCKLMGIQFTVPQNYVPQRWLSVYDVELSTKRMFEVYKVFYFAFLKKADKPVYQEVFDQVLEKADCSEEAKERVRVIIKELEAKRMTDDGKARKERIVEKILIQEKRMKLVLNFYVSVLAMLKRYVCVFQGSQTLVHKLHDKQLEIFTQFLACFIKPEHLVRKTPSQLKSLDLKEADEKFIRAKDVYVGGENEAIVESCRHKDSIVKDFRSQAVAAYIACGDYMQKKLPLDSKTLQSLSCLDPIVRSHSAATIWFKMLMKEFWFQRFLSDDGRNQLSMELLSFQSDSSLPIYTESTDMVQWWTAVMKTAKYPNLSKVAAASLSIFHGPVVESSFSVI